MKRKDFHYELPDELIASHPLASRTASRLMHIETETQSIENRYFSDIASLLRPNDVLVFNNTRVMKARLFGEKETGGKVEVLIERLMGDSRALAQIRASKPLKAGSRVILEKDLHIRVKEKVDDMYVIESGEHLSLPMIMQAIGHVPLPPYMNREEESIDSERYQTVYARRDGAVAAPTAGLHFDDVLLNILRTNGIAFAYVTLHVGAGTFQPVRAENIEDHVMHAEYVEVPADTCNQVRIAKKNNARVIAVGTTSVRSLETASVYRPSGNGEKPVSWIEPYYGDTDLFIRPGYRFKTVDAMITNFHLPESSLLMLVSAFAGKSLIEKAYRQAIAERYRFFSYGDSMFIDGRI